MNIQPVNIYPSYGTQQKTPKQSPSFKSFCADANACNEAAYRDYTLKHKGYSIMKASSTRIFRDLPSELAIAKLLPQNQKSQIKILGCSDGSEAWGYAIAIKEQMGENAKNVSIQAVDKAEHMIEAAKTGCIVMSDIEKQYAQGPNAIYKEKSPIAGCGWDKYLTKTTRPEKFNKILMEYPYMKFLENDPVVKKSVGKGLDWYEIKKEGLPEVSFECGDMFDYLNPDEEAENIVYVMANSAAYVFEKDPNQFLKLFDDIANKNKNKNVYIVIGDIENRILNTNSLGIPYNMRLLMNQIISSHGFVNVPQDELTQLGIKSQTTSNKIYRLSK